MERASGANAFVSFRFFFCQFLNLFILPTIVITYFRSKESSLCKYNCNVISGIGLDRSQSEKKVDEKFCKAYDRTVLSIGNVFRQTGTSLVVRRENWKIIWTNRSIDSDETVGYSSLFTRFRVSRRKREIPRLLTFTSAVDFPKYAKNSTTERSRGVERRPAAFLRTQHDAVTSNREWNCFQPSIYDIRIE